MSDFFLGNNRAFPRGEKSPAPGLPAAAPATSGIHELRHPEKERTATPPDRSPVEIRNAPGFLGKVYAWLREAVTYPVTWSGMGAALVCVTDSTVGLIGFPLATLWSVVSHNRKIREASQDHPPREEASGLLATIKDHIERRGFTNRLFSVWYALSSIEPFTAGAAWLGAALAVSSVSNLISAHRLDLEEIHRRGLKERDNSRGFFGSMPDYVREVLSSQAAWFNAGNVLFPIAGLVKGSTGLMNTVFFGAAVGSGLAGVAAAAVPLFTARKNPAAEKLSYHCCAASIAASGVFNFAAGNYLFSAASFAWAIANVFWMRLDHKNKALAVKAKKKED